MHLPFRTLLYRYFFAGWLLEGTADAPGLLADDDARTRRQQQGAWLPVYVLRWFLLACGLMLAGVALDALAHLPAAALALQAGALAGLGYAISIASTWARVRGKPA
jgi:hypothetical protein